MKKNMPELFNHENIFNENIIDFSEESSLFVYNSNELMDKLKYSDIVEFNEAVNRAIMTCKAMSISLNQHFKRIYIGDDKTLNAEWKFTSLACYLVIINANPANYHVAKAQLFFYK